MVEILAFIGALAVISFLVKHYKESHGIAFLKSSQLSSEKGNRWALLDRGSRGLEFRAVYKLGDATDVVFSAIRAASGTQTFPSEWTVGRGQALWRSCGPLNGYLVMRELFGPDYVLHDATSRQTSSGKELRSLESAAFATFNTLEDLLGQLAALDNKYMAMQPSDIKAVCTATDLPTSYRS